MVLGLPGDCCASCGETKVEQEKLCMARGEKHAAEQVVNLLRQVEFGVRMGS